MTTSNRRVYIFAFILLIMVLLSYTLYDKITNGLEVYFYIVSFHLTKDEYDIKKFKLESDTLMTVNYQQKIPFRLFQTFRSSKMISDLYQTCVINRTMNFEYSYNFSDDDDIQMFIKQHYPLYIEPYKSLIPGAYKSDLFRYLILYKYGGVYIDCKSSTIVPLREFIPSNASFVMFRDRLKGSLMNAFMACTAGHPILKIAIEKTIHNIKTQNYGINSLDVTGPQLLGRAFNIYFNKEELDDIDPGYYGDDIYIIGSFKTIGNSPGEFLVDTENNPLISRVLSRNYYSDSKRIKYVHNYYLGTVFKTKDN